MFSLLRVLVAATMAALGSAGCGSGTPLPPHASGAQATERQKQAFVEALKPRRPGRQLVAVLALNEGTETTDLLLPHAVLRRAGLADVQVVAPRRGPVMLYPALQVEAGQDLAGFDRAHPSGADYVIVPAMRRDDDPAVTAWLRRQADLGARVIAVCAGGLVAGRAGLLDGRRFASHWYYRDALLDRHPGATFVPHQRYVVDRDVATTTGITASVPAMLALVEAMGGIEKARAVAAELGAPAWDPTHDSTPFRLDAGRAWTYIRTRAAFWRHEQWRVDVHDGMDDIALALAVDAWSRTGLVSVEASAAGPVTLRSGLRLLAQPAKEGAPRLPLAPALDPLQQLERTLCEIGERYGDAQRDRVMLEMEHPGVAIACAR